MSAAELAALSRTDVRSPLPQEQVQAVLQAAPFVVVPGTFNTRDLGLVPTTAGAGASTEARIRPGFAFRTGSLGGLGAEGQAALRDRLGIRRIFDLRSVREHATQPDPEIDGITVVRTPSQEGDAVVELGDFIAGEGEAGYERMYLDVLRLYREGFRAILEHVRDRPTEPFLFHCNGNLPPLSTLKE